MLNSKYKQTKFKVKKCTIKIKEKYLGIATFIDIVCTDYLVKGENIKGEKNYHKSGNWSQLNSQLELSTLASGLARVTLLSFYLF